MKKTIAMIFTVASLSACSFLNTNTANTTTANANAKMQACLLTEATNMLTDGSIYTQNIKTSAKSISNTCAKKLALEAIPEQYQTAAELVINSVKAGRAASSAN